VSTETEVCQEGRLDTHPAGWPAGHAVGDLEVQPKRGEHAEDLAQVNGLLAVLQLVHEARRAPGQVGKLLLAQAQLLTTPQNYRGQLAAFICAFAQWNTRPSLLCHAHLTNLRVQSD
jgi:hypothetical protein